MVLYHYCNCFVFVCVCVFVSNMIVSHRFCILLTTEVVSEIFPNLNVCCPSRFFLRVPLEQRPLVVALDNYFFIQSLKSYLIHKYYCTHKYLKIVVMTPFVKLINAFDRSFHVS